MTMETLKYVVGLCAEDAKTLWDLHIVRRNWDRRRAESGSSTWELSGDSDWRSTCFNMLHLPCSKGLMGFNGIY